MQELIRRAGLTPPYISVIVPVYNAASFIRPTLDSLLAQTLEAIEIIPVDDCSPDDSFAVLEQYAALHPDKVRPVRQAVNQGPSPARWQGVQHARAPYIMFADSDDLLDARACELALREALTGGHDLVGITTARRNQWGELSVLQPPPKSLTNEVLIREGLAAFWSYLFAAELLQDETIFLPMFFEDAAATARIFARAKSIGWVREPDLYHYVQREGSIMSSFLSSTRRMDLFRADEELWQRADEAYRADFAHRIAARIAGNTRKYPELRVDCVQHARAFLPRLKPYLTAPHSARVLEELEAIAALPAEPVVPAIVYVDGFGGAAEEPVEQARFAAAWSVIVLDEGNCDPAAAPAYVREALSGGRHDIAAAWFAMQRIRETGGYYVARGYRLLPAVESLRLEPLSLCAGAARTLSLHFFGGAAGQPWWQTLLDCASPQEMGDRLRAAGLRLNGCEEQLDGAHVLPAIKCMLPLPEHFCCLHETGGMLHAVTDHIRQLNEEDRLRQQEMRKLQIYVADLTRQRDELRAQRDHFRQSRDELKQQLADAHASSLRGKLGALKRSLTGK